MLATSPGWELLDARLYLVKFTRSIVKKRIATVIVTAVVGVSVFTAPASAASWHKLRTFGGGTFDWITNPIACAAALRVEKTYDPSGTYRCRSDGNYMYLESKY